MKASTARLRSYHKDITAKFEELKKLDGSSQDSTPAGDGEVRVADEYSSKGYARFDGDGKPVAMDFSQWDPNDFEAFQGDDWSDDPEDSRIVEHFSISQREDGRLSYFSERSGTDSEGNKVWSPGPRVAVDPESGEVVGQYLLAKGPGLPQEFLPLED